MCPRNSKLDDSLLARKVCSRCFQPRVKISTSLDLAHRIRALDRPLVNWHPLLRA